jgi:hypothetical protein
VSLLSVESALAMSLVGVGALPVGLNAMSRSAVKRLGGVIGFYFFSRQGQKSILQVDPA